MENNPLEELYQEGGEQGDGIPQASWGLFIKWKQVEEEGVPDDRYKWVTPLYDLVVGIQN